MHRRSSRALIRLVSMGAATALATTSLALSPATAEPGNPEGFSLAQVQPVRTGTVAADKAPSSGLAETPAGLKRITSPKKIPVMIKYDVDALASYGGTVQGLDATSPSVTGEPLNLEGDAESAYLGHLDDQETEISAAVTEAVPAAKITGSFQVVYGGVSAVIPGNTVREILGVPGVVAVQRDSLRQPLTDSSTDFINAPPAYDELGSTSNAGEGVLLGNLDTGVWPEHPSFADQGNLPAYTGPALPCEFGDNPLTPAPDVFECNNKLVGGAAFLDTYDLVGGPYDYPDSARDAGGHGSHTSSTSAGNIVEDAQTMGPVLDIHGVAPGAQVMEYRVCAVGGCYGSDSTAAVEQAILDGVDVINFSISGGEDPFTDPVELAFLDAYAAGVFVAASAGNSGPGAGTTDHLGPWLTTVAASTQTREFASTLELTAADGATYEVDGATITPGVGPLPVVAAAAAPYSDALCQEPAPAGSFTGKIVVCQRGGNGRVEKGFNVLQGGAEGMILYNPTLADVETDNHFLPAIHIADGTDLVAFLGAHTGITGQWADGATRDGQGDVMAAFSSRGPGGVSIKPDITAPGVQILAAQTPTPDEVAGGPAGEYYQAIAGTSMSSPHIAGVALLLKALHPDWTPGQIRSAMMTQSLTEVLKEDLATPADPFDMGAGRVDVGRAMDAPVTISETAENFTTLTPDPVRAIDLNIPSINAPTMPGRITTTRTLHNETGRYLAVRARTSVGDGSSIQVSPSKFVIRPGQSKTVRITLRSSAPDGEQQFGEVRFLTPKGTAHLPVAFIHQQGSVALTQTCDAASVKVGHKATCTVSATNNDFASQTVDVTTSVTKRLKLLTATGATVRHGVAKASATLAGALQGVPSVAPGVSPAGYLPLDLFEVVPDPIGDEGLITYDVPEFRYNGVSYTSLSVDSNGYLVVGGGTSADNNCCNLPTGPSSAPPNNILAPFWTDLDGSDAPGISVAVLEDSATGDAWLIFQWEVDVFGTNDLRSFQTWIGLNGVQDISFTYSAPQADPAGQDFLVGAENATGQGDVEAVLPTGEDLVVTSTDPAPGDTLTYSVRVKGLKPGWANVHTELTADLVPGVTTVDTPLPVTRH